MSKPDKKMDTKAKREETMRQMVTGEMPIQDGSGYFLERFSAFSLS